MGVKTPKMGGQKKQYRKYNVGEKVSGVEHNASDIPSQYVPAIMTKDRFVITQNNLMLIGEEQDAELVQDDLASDKLLNRFKMFYNANGQGTLKAQQVKSKFMINGALIGGVTCFGYAVMKGANKKTAVVLGLVVGALIGKFVADYKNKTYYSDES
jgi:hypothetical protein